MAELKIVGLVEHVSLIGKKSANILALFDSGARTTSVDMDLAARAHLGPVIGTMTVKNASMKQAVKRVKVKAKIKIKGRMFETEVNLQDRSHMRFPIIIGRNILTGNFIIDANRNKDLLKDAHKLGIKSIKSWIRREK